MTLIDQYMRYIKSNPKKYWLRAKWYGWGWTPATWQGWLVTLIYVVLIIFFSSTIDENSPRKEVILMCVLPTILLTASFIGIAYKKGEKPKWNWGKPKDWPTINK